MLSLAQPLGGRLALGVVKKDIGQMSVEQNQYLVDEITVERELFVSGVIVLDTRLRIVK